MRIAANIARKHSGVRWLWRRRMAPLWGAAIGLIALGIYWPGVVGLLPNLSEYCDLQPLRALDLRIGDFLQNKFVRQQPLPNTPKICVVGITPDGLEKFGPMPWPRRTHAQLIESLDRMGARVIAFDIFFPTPQPDDEILAAACLKSGKVILPRWGVMPERRPYNQYGFGANDWAVRKANANDRAAPAKDGVFRCQLREATQAVYQHARGNAHLNVFYDDDLVTRRVPAAVGGRDKAEFHLPLGVVAAMASQGVLPSTARLEHGVLVFGNLKIPLDASGCMLVNFQPEMIDTRPADVRTITSEVPWLKTKDTAPIEFYPYLDVLEGRVPASNFKNAVVLVGQCIWESREDVHMTPNGSQFGVFVQAMLLYSTLNRSFLAPVAPQRTAFAAFGLSLFLGAICFSLRVRGSTYAIFLGGCLLIAAGAGLALGTVTLFRQHGLILDGTPFLMVLGLNLVGGIAASTARTAREADQRALEIDVLLSAGAQSIENGQEDSTPQVGLIPGAAYIAMSASLAQRSPEIAGETFFRAIPCEGCVLLMVGDDGKFDRTILRGLEDKLAWTDVREAAEQMAYDAIKLRRLIAQSVGDPDWPCADTSPTLRNMMGIPVVVHGQPLAAIVLLNKRPTSTSPDEEFSPEDMRLVSALRYQAAALLENARRYRLEYAMFDGFAQSLAKAVDFRDGYTCGHSERVAELSAGIAGELSLSAAEIEVVQRSATLHDVGKIGVSDAVLKKPGRLSDDEFALIKAHAANGYEILKAAPSFGALLPGIRHHHERYDGRGYPDALAHEEIPLIARIIAVADAYDAMSSDRVYRAALGESKAREELNRGAGTQFDPVIVQAMLRYLDSQKATKKDAEYQTQITAPPGQQA